MTGQLGVPVTTDGNEVIAGFDAGRLKAMATRNKQRGLGLAVKDHPEGGVLVGRVRTDSPGGRAGILPGDIVVELSGIPIGSAEDLEKVAARWDGERPTSMMVRRDGDLQSVILAPAPAAADLLP